MLHRGAAIRFVLGLALAGAGLASLAIYHRARPRSEEPAAGSEVVFYRDPAGIVLGDGDDRTMVPVEKYQPSKREVGAVLVAAGTRARVLEVDRHWARVTVLEGPQRYLTCWVDRTLLRPSPQ